MNNSKAIAASVAMVMAAAIGTGGLVAWQQSSAAAPNPAASSAPMEATEVVVEYVDAPSPTELDPEMPPEAETATSADSEPDADEAGAEHGGDEYVDDDEDEDGDDYEDGDND